MKFILYKFLLNFLIFNLKSIHIEYYVIKKILIFNKIFAISQQYKIT